MTTTTTATTTTSTSKSSAGASILTSLNAGAGIDTDTLVTNLVAAQKSSLEDSITAAQTANTAQISAAAGISSDITQFSSALDSLIAGGTLMSTPTSSDTSIATATAIAGSRLGNLSSTITVTSLATAQTIQSADMTNFSSGSSATTLTIATAGTTTSTTDANGNTTSSTTGNASTPITIPANASIKDVAAAINAAKTGVTASVVSSGGRNVLVLKGTTGAANAFTVSSNDAALSGLTYSGAAGDPMTASSAAADAVLNVDGVDVKSASNTLTNVVAGVTVTIAKPGTVTLTGTRPTDAITGAINDFVSAYNTLKSDLDSVTASATSSAAAGALNGNSTIRDMRRQLTQLTTTQLTGSGTITTLAQLGVKTGQDGTLSVDATTLSRILGQYPDDVEAMFNPAQSSSSSAVTITSKVGAVAAGVYSLTGLAAASGSTAATGTVNGIAMTGGASTLTAPTGSGASGLTLRLSSTGTVPSSATLTIDLGLGGALAMIKNLMTGTNGSLTTLQTRLNTQTSTLADQLTAADAKLTVYHDRLVSQFSTMNTRVSAYKATASYLTQQVDLWTKGSSS